MRYAVVIEKAAADHSAYVPDLPGCIVTGSAVAEAETLIREAIELHLSGSTLSRRKQSSSWASPISGVAPHIEKGANDR